MILKQSVNFRISGNVDGMMIQQDVADWCRDVLNPSIDKGLAWYEQTDEVILLNDIRLDIDIDTTVDWKEGLAEKILYKLKEKLHAKIAGTDQAVSIKTLPDSFSDEILYYVKHGLLPWYAGIKNRQYLEGELKQWLNQASPSVIRQFAVNIPDEKAAIRLVDLLSRPGLEKFMILLLEEKDKSISLLLEDIEFIASSVTNEYSFQQRLVKLFAGMLIPVLSMETAIQKWIDHIEIKYPGQILKIKTEKIISAEIKMIVSRVQMTGHKTKDILKEKEGAPGEKLSQQENVKSISKKGFPQEQKNETLKSKPENGSAAVEPQNKIIKDVEKNDTITGSDEFRKTLEEGVYIDNAGAVIIAPFLISLFSRVGLLTGNDINDADKALHLLHYCVTGDTRPAEFELFFPKILCGVNVENAIATDLLLSKEELAEADEMLSSVIEYWAVLKNSSVQGLREAFLQRNGKLTFIGNEWRLQVEQKSYDMLLQQLPWNISMIKLPWMKNLLRTEWV